MIFAPQKHKIVPPFAAIKENNFLSTSDETEWPPSPIDHQNLLRAHSYHSKAGIHLHEEDGHEVTKAMSDDNVLI